MSSDLCGHVCGIPKDAHQTEEHPWAEAASPDIDELRKAVEEALALVAGPGNGTWTRFRPIEEWQRLWHVFDAARALLSAGDKAPR